MSAVEWSDDGENVKCPACGETWGDTPEGRAAFVQAGLAQPYVRPPKPPAKPHEKEG